MNEEIPDVKKLLDEIYDNEANLTDEELAAEISKVWKTIPNNMEVYFPHSHKIDIIVHDRVRAYCDKHDIELKDYDGVLPFRIFLIDVSTIDIDDVEDYIANLAVKFKKSTKIIKDENR